MIFSFFVECIESVNKIGSNGPILAMFLLGILTPTANEKGAVDSAGSLATPLSGSSRRRSPGCGGTSSASSSPSGSATRSLCSPEVRSGP